ncbi:hypothetical protein LCGC14_1284630 [marine sediment metagenome]|uniref:Uncharacterized protein n=1 Tax=marine sediment metagenome TaxID=412755 RepID=A0A0F9NXB4_9ZZZZ
MTKLPAIMIAAVVAVLAFWGWLHFIHDPRVREAALDQVRIDSVMVDLDSLQARTERRTARVDLLEGLSASLRDSLEALVEEQGRSEIALEGATEATDALLNSVSRETSGTAAIVRIRFTLQSERKAWAAEVRGLKAQVLTLEDLLESAEARILLVSQNYTETQSTLDRTIADWLDAEQRYQRARNPGFFRRLEISLPFAALAAVAGLLAGISQ